MQAGACTAAPLMQPRALSTQQWTPPKGRLKPSGKEPKPAQGGFMPIFVRVSLGKVGGMDVFA
jgi:hypothetical protein